MKRNSKKPNIQKAILRKIADKPAVAVDTMRQDKDPKTSYAFVRSIKNLVETGHAEMLHSDNQNYIKITPKGKVKLNTMLLDSGDSLISLAWDEQWRIIILDIPENRKSEREALRYLLKKANFTCIKNTVWISPLPYEHLFTNIKKDLGLSTELMIIVTDKLDEETSRAFLKAVKN